MPLKEYDKGLMGNFKCTIIYDNRKHNPKLNEGFGFSCLVEWENLTILFDTGGNEKHFFSNINRLNIQLDAITHVVFSHQHWDHTAGFANVLKNISAKAKVYIPNPFVSKLIRIVPDNTNLIKISDFHQITPNTYSQVLKARTWHISDCFSLYEQSLIFDTNKGLIVLTGCGHPGIINIIKQAKNVLNKEIYYVMGGFHLYHSLKHTSESIVKKFKYCGVKNVAPCHCTGEIAVKQFEKIYKENFHSLGTGSILTVSL